MDIFIVEKTQDKDYVKRYKLTYKCEGDRQRSIANIPSETKVAQHIRNIRKASCDEHFTLEWYE